jgi:hypothetical protein
MPFGAYTVGDFMYVFGGRNEQRTLKYEPTSDRWSEVAPMPSVRSNFATAVVDNDVYIIGGIRAVGIFDSSVYKYTTDDNTWTMVTPVQAVRNMVGARFHACALGGLIYVAGGHTYDIRRMLRYEPSSDTWSTLPSILQSRPIIDIFTLDNCVYVGYHNTDDTMTIEKYEPEFDRWSVSMHTPFSCSGICTTTIQVEIFDAMIARMG